MTVPTINAVIADVMFMAELDRLLLFKIAAGEVRRTRNLRINVKRSSGENNPGDHADACDVVCTFMKELGHYYD